MCAKKINQESFVLNLKNQKQKEKEMIFLKTLLEKMIQLYFIGVFLLIPVMYSWLIYTGLKTGSLKRAIINCIRKI